MGRRMRCAGCGQASDSFSAAQMKALATERLCGICEKAKTTQQSPPTANTAAPPQPAAAQREAPPPPSAPKSAPPVQAPPQPAEDHQHDGAHHVAETFPPGTYVNQEERAFFTVDGKTREISYQQGDNELRGHYEPAADEHGPFLAIVWNLHIEWNGSGPDAQGVERDINDECSADIRDDPDDIPGLWFNERFYHCFKRAEA